MSAILTIGPCELKFGYFFHFYNATLDDTFDETECIRSPSPVEDYGQCIVTSYKTRPVQRFKCSLNADHGKVYAEYDYEADLVNAPYPIPPFLTVADADRVIVNDWLADQLKSSGLKGFHLLPASVDLYPIWYKGNKKSQLSTIHQLSFEGKNPCARFHIEPASANKCPFCGIGPIVCPECGTLVSHKEICGSSWSVSEDLHQGKGDRRIKVERLGHRIEVIDASSWDGTDFMGYSTGGWITRRALDWLLSIHAGPFFVQPVGVNVLGLTIPELERLELARGPLSGNR